MSPERIIDIHSHILPGIDDGSQSMEQTLKMLRIAEEEGITDMIATPHHKYGRHNASPATVNRLRDEVQKLALEEGLHIRIHTGNELFYYTDIEDVIREERICYMGNSDCILVEFNPMENYTYIHNALYQLQCNGYQPVIAHIERYLCIAKDKKKANELHDMGIRIQVNADSIVGDNGFGIKGFTKYLLKNELIDYVGTDSHSHERRAPRMTKCVNLLYKKYNKEYVDRILYLNAEEDFELA